jgi:hypothetical protein
MAMFTRCPRMTLRFMQVLNAKHACSALIDILPYGRPVIMDFVSLQKPRFYSEVYSR